ncbi:AAA domain containing protein [uncultured Caudovirales phage]|uniref:AAA domain containing protein n=1 Tax=uncultured Caudovirales phage TaxID=2100421 RepID=A0A6J5L6R4_9CAUD|nr:AAA domain containing protein [uncultured Caudovirales phage]
MALTENRTVTTKEARSRIIRCFNNKRPVFLWGAPGLGKSDLIASITEQMGGKLYDLRMPLLEPTDLRGIPYFNKEAGVMDWAPPVDLPSAEEAAKYPIVVLFLDEMNAAAPAVQASGYQLILNRKVGKYTLPDNVVIVAAGNRESDKGVTYRMPSPLANRFVHLEIRVDHESWEQWAIEHNIHQDVIGYIGFAKQDLFDFDPRSSSRSFATPRTWSFVSELLQDETATESELSDLTAGTIGEGTAVKFMAHRKISSKMPQPLEILNGTVTTLSTKEISAMYSLTVNMCYELKDLYIKSKTDKSIKWDTMANNFLVFIMDNFTTELVVLGTRIALTTYELPFSVNKMPSLDAFHKRFGKFVMAAVAK